MEDPTLTSAQSQEQQQQQQQQQQVDQVYGQLQKQLEPLLPVTLVLSGLIVLLMIVNFVQKWRTHRAILHMDRNLKKLLELQTVGVHAEHLTEKENDNKEKSGDN